VPPLPGVCTRHEVTPIPLRCRYCQTYGNLRVSNDVFHYTELLMSYILCDCEAIAYLRFCHLGHFFMEPSDFYDAPMIKVLHFIRSVELIKGQSNRSLKVAVQGPDLMAHPLHLDQFYI
jgi:hypothetical protein